MGRNNPNRRRESDSGLALDRGRVNSFITQHNPGELVDCANALGESLAKIRLSSSQIRNIFGVARRLRSTWPTPPAPDHSKLMRTRQDLMLLKPKLAYQSARHPSVQTLNVWLEEAINLIYAARNNEAEEYDRFTRFFDFFEATLAYHKYYGGS